MQSRKLEVNFLSIEGQYPITQDLKKQEIQHQSPKKYFTVSKLEA